MGQTALNLLDILAGKLGISLSALCITVFCVLIPIILLYYASVAYFVLFSKGKQQRKLIPSLRYTTVILTVFLFLLFISALLLICL